MVDINGTGSQERTARIDQGHARSRALAEQREYQRQRAIEYDRQRRAAEQARYRTGLHDQWGDQR